jgi:uncharacterized protein (DUF302 family)
MKNIVKVLINTVFIMSVSINANEAQNLQIFSADNAKGLLSAKSIEKAFNDSGLVVDVNNDMNSIFSKRYGKVHHKNYNLAIFTNPKSVASLMKKFPKIGMITPLSMSIYEDNATKTINIATLSLAGMARVTDVPTKNPDLIEYAKSVDAALHAALPNGAYLSVAHNTKVTTPLTTEFTIELEVEDGETYVDAKDSFKEELESELGPVGFLIPKSYTLKDDAYDFFDTYSIIRFNAIYPVSKDHPEAGAYAPFSLVIYKKKDEKEAHIAFPSISNWISDLDITDKEAVKEVQKTHDMVKAILEELTE